MELLALEYPPYTSLYAENGGDLLAELNHRLDQVKGLRLQPVFLPPARASLRMQNEQWCTSFLPPIDSSNAPFLLLSDNPVPLGLFRRYQSGSFHWQHLYELSGRRVAFLRVGEDSPYVQPFIQAGIEPFYVESVQQGFLLLARGRVDYMYADEASYHFLRDNDLLPKVALQFSDTIILMTHFPLWINPACEAGMRMYSALIRVNPP